MMPEAEMKDLLNEIAVNNSRVSFKRLYMLYYNKMFSLAKSIVKSDVVAEEVTDDVFLNLWVHRTRLPLIGNFTYYCYTAIKNKSLTYLSKPQVKKVDIDEIELELADTSATGEDQLICEDLSKVIDSSLKALPEQCRLIFKLLREDGLKYRQVAELLDISIKTVEYHMGNALKRIAEDVLNSQKTAVRAPANFLLKKS
jgi:RNA polymerase sigma-70 factor (ECF subfamily)